METSSRDIKWYVIHTYSGYENKVKANLEAKVASMGMEEVVQRILVPTEDTEVEDKNGNKRVVKRKIFPGYVFVEMEVNDRSWYIVRNTPGVTGFVGSATKPVPLTDKEVERILNKDEKEEKVIPHIDLEIGESVRIKSGAFVDKYGTVTNINREKGTVTLLVELFNQETPVELEYSQIEK